MECSVILLRNWRLWSAYLVLSHDHNNVFTTLATTWREGRKESEGRGDRESATATSLGRPQDSGERRSEVNARSVIHDTCMKTCSPRERVRKSYNHCATHIDLKGRCCKARCSIYSGQEKCRQRGERKIEALDVCRKVPMCTASATIVIVEWIRSRSSTRMKS